MFNPLFEVVKEMIKQYQAIKGVKHSVTTWIHTVDARNPA